jgi:voltage-gated potassium channel
MNARRIAIFGYNSLSFEVASRLNLKEHQLIIIDADEEILAAADEKGFHTRVIDYRSDDDLKQIGIGRDIDVIFCFFSEDCKNVFLTISARALDKDLEIISVVDDPDSADKLLAAGANKIINPYEICGNKINEMVKKPHIASILDQTIFGRQDLNIAEVRIPQGSYLEYKTVSDLNLSEKHNLILIGVIDKELGDELHFAIGEKEHILDAGDILVVLGPSREIRSYKNAIAKDTELNI